MSIFKTAYDTTIGSSVVLNKTELAIKQCIIQDSLQHSTSDFVTDLDINPIMIGNNTSNEVNIPYFIHPLLIEDVHKKKHLCVDVRQFVRNTPENYTGEFNVKNQSEFTLSKCRLALNLIWLTQRPEALRDISYIPNAIFSNWISDGLANRFALDPKDKIMLAIIASFYYQSLFTEFNTFIEEDRQKIATSIIKATRAPAKLVFEVTDKIEKLSNISDFCDTCKAILENTRLENLNSGLLITILGNSWFGMGAKETLAVALEHPPTWIALVYAAFTERTFKKSMLSRVSEPYAGNKGGNDFLRAFSHLIYSVTKNENDSNM